MIEMSRAGLPVTQAFTSRSKAQLWEALNPFVCAMHAEVAPVGPDSLAVAEALLEDTRRLARGEPFSAYVASIDFQRPALVQLDLLLGLSNMRAALSSFRGRYFGWNPVVGEPLWFIGGLEGLDFAKAMRPRMPPPPAAPEAPGRNIEALREKLARLVETRARGLIEEQRAITAGRPAAG